MSEAEKQEGQKTVVAFITGLLIGGLLVWVFSTSPEKTPVETELETDTEENVVTTTQFDETDTPRTAPVTTTNPTSRPVTVGNGSIAVIDQPAGSVVVLGDVEYPNDQGWIVVREYQNDIAGNILGAARYNEAEGLSPAAVNLLRGTTAGNSYQVMFYTDDGDKDFNLRNDARIDGIVATFKAN